MTADALALWGLVAGFVGAILLAIGNGVLLRRVGNWGAPGATAKRIARWFNVAGWPLVVASFGCQLAAEIAR